MASSAGPDSLRDVPRVILRICAYAAVLALLGWGLWGESHAVHDPVGGQARQVDGAGFTADATVDGYALMGGRLIDAYGRLAPDQVQLKDCKT